MVYKYHHETVEFKLTKLRDTETAEYYRVVYPSPEVSPFAENNLVYGLYVKPKSPTSTAIICLQGFRVERDDPWKNTGYYFAKHGLASLSIVLPYHRARTPKGFPPSEAFLSVNPDQQLRNFEQAVADVRRGIDLLEQLGYERFHIWGKSLGAMVGIIAHALDTRINRGVYIGVGGNFGRIVWRGMGLSDFRHAHMVRGVTRHRCYQTRKNYWRFMESVASLNSPQRIDEIKVDGEYCIDLPKKVNAPSECYYADPITFCPFIRSENVLIIKGIIDPVIPLWSTLEMLRYLPHARVMWLPLGHISMGLIRAHILRWSVSFFAM